MRKSKSPYPERNAEICRRVAAGESMASVARDFDLTRSRIEQIVHFKSRRTHWGDSCVFPAIKAWMQTNRIAWNEFSEMCDLSYQTLRHALSDGGNPTKRVIDEVLKLTGMSYEEAFAKEEAA
jgi:DNA-binding phage protein